MADTGWLSPGTCSDTGTSWANPSNASALDGSDSPTFSNIPISTRFQVWQEGFGKTDDFLVKDGQFNVVLCTVGSFSAEGYDDLSVVFEAVQPEEEGEK